MPPRSCQDQPPSKLLGYAPDMLPIIATCAVEACYPFQYLVLGQFTITNRSHLPSSDPRTGRCQHLKKDCQRIIPEPESLLLTLLRCTEICDCRMTAIGILAAGTPSCFCIRLNSLVDGPGSGTLCQLTRYTGKEVSKRTMLVSPKLWPGSPAA